MAEIRGNLFGGFTGKLGKTYGRYVHGVNLGAMMPTKRDGKKLLLSRKTLWRFAARSWLRFLTTAGLKVASLARSSRVRLRQNQQGLLC